MKLNLGCGPVQPPGWINVDGSNRAWLASRLPWVDRLLVTLCLIPPTEFNTQTFHANLQRRFPWQDSSAEKIYMGELLEHLTREEGIHVVRECYRVLKPGGILRIRVPDNTHFWKNYLEEYEKIKQQPMEKWTLAHTRWVEMYFREICVSRPLPWQSMGHFHKWMYDEVSLIQLLVSAGFQNVERKSLHQSRIPDIKKIETREDLIVEATRP